jgi:hypothetical protein
LTIGFPVSIDRRLSRLWQAALSCFFFSSVGGLHCHVMNPAGMFASGKRLISCHGADVDRNCACDVRADRVCDALHRASEKNDIASEWDELVQPEDP